MLSGLHSLSDRPHQRNAKITLITHNPQRWFGNAGALQDGMNVTETDPDQASHLSAPKQAVFLGMGREQER